MLPPLRIVSPRPGICQIAAPAKLNLSLRIFPPRADGFHNLETWMVPLSWHDTLTVSDPLSSASGPAGGSNAANTAQPELTLDITGRSENIPTDPEKNLVGRAALLLAKTANVPPRAHITLHKVLPPGGGIGGGSSDAASTLLALNELWNLHLPEQKLCDIAAQLGSDIPFFVRNQPTLCTGRGEIMTPLPFHHPLFAVLLLPPIGCPTKDVYQAFDAGHGKTSGDIDWQHLATLPADLLNEKLVNDLTAAAFHIAPLLADLQRRAQAAISRPIHLTGSGSTLFTLAGSSVEAAALTEKLSTALSEACSVIPAKILHGADES